MALTGASRAAAPRRLVSLATCTALLLPGSLEAATTRALGAPVPAAAGPSAPWPCKATLAQIIDDALLSGEAGQSKLVAFAAPPGRLLLPATGGATPQAAVIGQFGAKNALGQCGFETTAYVVDGIALLVAFLDMSPQAKRLEKKLESLPPSRKDAIENFFITGKGTNPATLLGATKSTSPLAASEMVTAVKLTRLTPTQATMNVTALEVATEMTNGHPQKATASVTTTGVEASKIGGRWFLSGSQNVTPPRPQP
ncbi:MAG TPA: hypothetical protein VME20_12035 [Acidimicrobiales bacterium]|nr:hypothetical protein [Acidimicrobiales bacterium]